MSGLSLALPLLFAQARIEARPSLAQTVDVINETHVIWLHALVVAAIVVAVVASVVLRFARRRRNDNRHLFNELCSANQLSRGQSRALRELSKQLQIANPNRLFLESELWRVEPVQDTPVDSLPNQADQPATVTAQQELYRLREHLFAPVV